MKIKIDTKVIMEISDIEERCLKNDLADIEGWIVGAITGKINSCKKRLIKEWYPKLMADPDVATIPANEEEFIDIVTARPDYKDQAAKNEEEDLERNK